MASNLRILVAESTGFSSRAAAVLQQIGVPTFGDLNRDELLSQVQDADVLWVRLRHLIDGEILRRATKLRMIVTPTTGLNHIDTAEAERLGVDVLSLRRHTDFLRNIRATAEHTMALILSLLRHVPEAVSHVKDGGWNRDEFKGNELYGKTVGIVGYGRIGQLVGKYLSAFDTRILAADPNFAQSDAGGAVNVSLFELLTESDIVTLHVNYSADKQGWFAELQFSAMKQGAYFVNTSRGELVNEAALIDALRTNKIAGAALDVVANEQSLGSENNPLIAYGHKNRNLLMTPHIGGCTIESMEKTEFFLAERLAEMLWSTSPYSRSITANTK